MTYALLDDKTYRNKSLRACGAHAALLYTVTLIECAAEDGDGVLDAMAVKDAASMYDLTRQQQLAGRLVSAGMWHDAATLEDCPLCLEWTPKIGEGSYLIHEWWKPLLHKDGKNDPVKRDRELRRKRIWRNKALVLAIRNRDKDRCRYCGIRCSDPADPDRLAATRLTLDHVDPWGPDTAANLVVACRRCNGIKRDRTPAEAGMVLLKPGTRAEELEILPAHLAAGTGADTDQTPSAGVGSADQPHVRDARETGPGRHGPGRDGAGSGSGPGPEQTPGGR